MSSVALQLPDAIAFTCTGSYPPKEDASVLKFSDMPLLDRFRPPLRTRRHWHSFHNAWSTYLADDLNPLLPEGYFAEPNAHVVV